MEITGFEFAVLGICYGILVVGIPFVRHRFEWWRTVFMTDAPLGVSLVSSLVVVGVVGFVGSVIVWSLFHEPRVPADRCLWWALGMPILCHAVLSLLHMARYFRWRMMRARKLSGWLGDHPPKDMDELGEYIELIITFHEFVERIGRWRDGAVVWTGIWWRRPLRSGMLETITLGVELSLGLGKDGRERREIDVPSSEWRRLHELALAGIHRKWWQTQEEITQRAQREAQAAVERERRRQEVKQCEREEFAALLEGRPQQVEATVAEVVQEAMTTEPEDHPQDEPFPVGYRPRAIELEGD